MPRTQCSLTWWTILALTLIGAAPPVQSQKSLHKPAADVSVFPDLVRFAYDHDDASFIRVEIFDEAKDRMFDSGVSEAISLDWDLALESGEYALPGIYFYSVQAWDSNGDPIKSQVGKIAVRPDEMPAEDLRDLSGESPSLSDHFEITLPAFDVTDFSIFGRLGVGTAFPARAVHLQGRNAVFRMDRDVDSAAFLMSRTAPNNFNSVWKTYVLGVNAKGQGDGAFIINDLGGALAGAGVRRLTITNEGKFGLNDDGPDAWLEVRGSGASDLLVLNNSGGSAFRVEADGDVFADGSYNCGQSSGCFNAGTGADVAERIDALDEIEPGDVVEIDPDRPNHFRRSDSAMSGRVAGIVSTSPAITLGNNFDGPAEIWVDTRPLLALAGRVPVKATAAGGAIEIGDLLVSSPIPGYAMRCAKPKKCVGAVIGKALEPLTLGEGVIEAQVMLR